MLVEELRKCGETLVGLSEGLADLFSGSAEEEKQPAKKSAAKKKAAEESKSEVSEEKTLTLEDVRAVCADKSRSGFTEEVKAILNSTVWKNCRRSTRQNIKHCLLKWRCLAMPDKHAVLSASSSHRWLECPPSALLCSTAGDAPSEFAMQGTDATAFANIS